MKTTAAGGRAAGAAPPEGYRAEAARRRSRRERLLYWTMLGLTALAPALPAMLLETRSQVFLLKAIAVLLLAGLPGWLYLEFVRSKGYSLYGPRPSGRCCWPRSCCPSAGPWWSARSSTAASA